MTAGNFDTFARIADLVCEAQALLSDPDADRRERFAAAKAALIADLRVRDAERES